MARDSKLKWFTNLSSIEEVKQHYRELVKKYHPDVSGKDTNSEMADINREYKIAIRKAGNNENMSAEDINDEILEQENYKEVLDKLFKIPNIVVELAGSWIWISGNTYPVKDKIKDAGCYFAFKKKMWYWRPPEEKNRKKRGSMPIEDIRKKYNAKVLNKPKKQYYLNDLGKIVKIKTKKKK